MEKKTFTVPNISCGHCVHTVKSEVSELPGVKAVEVAQAEKQVTVEWEAPATWEQIEARLVEINYPPATSPNVVLS
jgi:copper chaperone CopZ